MARRNKPKRPPVHDRKPSQVTDAPGQHDPATVFRPADDRKPSQVTDVYWLFAKRKIGDYPTHTEKGGKWLVFVPAAKLDEVWAKIKDATEKGLLGGSAKVGTAMPNPNATNSTAKVICVNTYDWTDEG